MGWSVNGVRLVSVESWAADPHSHIEALAWLSWTCGMTGRVHVCFPDAFHPLGFQGNVSKSGHRRGTAWSRKEHQ